MPKALGNGPEGADWDPPKAGVKPPEKGFLFFWRIGSKKSTKVRVILVLTGIIELVGIRLGEWCGNFRL